MYELLKRLKTRDAALLYCYLSTKKSASTSKVTNVSLESIAAGMNDEELKTSRAANFTARIIRDRVAELEEAGIIERVPSEDDKFDVVVFSTADPVAPRGKKEKPIRQTSSSESVPNTVTGTVTGTETVTESVNARARIEEINIYKNKQINNQGCEEKTNFEVRTDCRRSIDDAIKRVDFSSEKVAAFRSKLVEIIWEEDLNRELVDRLTAAAVLGIGGLNDKGAFKLCREAADAKRLYEKTDGRVGKKRIWQSLGYAVKRIYDAEGYEWTSTKIENEPAPKRQAIIPAFAAVLSTPKTKEKKSEEPKAAVVSTTASSDSNAIVEGFTAAEALNTTLEEFERVVARRCKTKSAMETRIKAFSIRDQLRRLVASTCEIIAGGGAPATARGAAA
ncbi:MAG: hypothetical protein ACI4NP_00560 [Thermoguttaceae bacterium]